MTTEHEQIDDEEFADEEQFLPASTGFDAETLKQVVTDYAEIVGTMHTNLIKNGVPEDISRSITDQVAPRLLDLLIL